MADKETPLMSNAEIDDIEKKLKAWKEDPTLITEWARDASMRAALVLEHIILNARGRRAPQDVSVAVDRLTNMLSAMAAVGLIKPEALLSKRKPALKAGDDDE